MATDTQNYVFQERQKSHNASNGLWQRCHNTNDSIKVVVTLGNNWCCQCTQRGIMSEREEMYTVFWERSRYETINVASTLEILALLE
eukprot:5806244-Amphidinium_carterae.1